MPKKSKKTFIVKSGICPICESNNIEYLNHTWSNDMVRWDCKCLDCNTYMNMEYSLNFEGTMTFGDTAADSVYYSEGAEVERMEKKDND